MSGTPTPALQTVQPFSCCMAGPTTSTATRGVDEAGRRRPSRSDPVSARLRHDALLVDETPRNGEQAALAADAIALLDALEIERAIVGGFDWGARTPTSSPRSGRSGA
jgi:pimeloyl-ACP methyl ester carboxylesterase